jgi:hypothetical protein
MGILAWWPLRAGVAKTKKASSKAGLSLEFIGRESYYSEKSFLRSLMKKEELGPLGAWALGLLLFIATLLIIRWTIDFVTWSTVDSGWAQAIGAVAAIFFSYRAGLKQSKDALASVHAADKLATQRKFESVVAVVDSTKAYAERVSTAFYDGRADFLTLHIEYSDHFMQNVINTLQIIPAHELGSYEAVTALLIVRNAATDFRGNVLRALDTFDRYEREKGGLPLSIKFDAAALDLCLHRITWGAESLQEIFSIRDDE